MLMLMDRVVMTFLPLYFWGAEAAAAWIILRGWMFLLMSTEGGRAGRLSKRISDLLKNGEDAIACRAEYSNCQKKMISWSVFIFCGNLLLASYLNYSNVELLGLHISEYYWECIVITIYACFYYQSQLAVYGLRGFGEVFRGQMLVNLIKSIEVAALIILPILSQGIMVCLVAVTLIRLAAAIYITLLFLLRMTARLSRSRTDENSSTSEREIGGMITVGYFLYPLYPAVYNFFSVGVVSTFLAPIAVVQFSINKLFGRAIYQLSQVLSRVLWPELLKAPTAEEHSSLAKGVTYTFIKFALVVFLISLVVSYFLDGYDMGGAKFSLTLSATLCVVALLGAVNDVLMSILISVERHVIPLFVRFIGLASVFIAVSFVHQLSLIFIAVALAIYELFFLAFVQLYKNFGAHSAK
ncbi:hypothetical protein [Microbulbifer sp. MCCC 1A16149]|uniref:hypothetical protein n=1 Tax=Microbulbifer sp. MCCC 1A16149 TaxID=3411322 RepID=UPI003D1462FE